MPAFSFEALDAQGATRKGVIDADTARAARALLRGQALVPLAVQPVGNSGAATADGASPDRPRTCTPEPWAEK